MSEYRGVRWFEKEQNIKFPRISVESLRISRGKRYERGISYLTGVLSTQIVIDLQTSDMAGIDTERAPAAYLEFMARDEVQRWIRYIARQIRKNKSLLDEFYFVELYKVPGLISFTDYRENTLGL